MAGKRQRSFDKLRMTNSGGRTVSKSKSKSMSKRKSRGGLCTRHASGQPRHRMSGQAHGTTARCAEDSARYNSRRYSEQEHEHEQEKESLRTPYTTCGQAGIPPYKRDALGTAHATPARCAEDSARYTGKMRWGLRTRHASGQPRHRMSGQAHGTRSRCGAGVGEGLFVEDYCETVGLFAAGFMEAVLFVQPLRGGLEHCGVQMNDLVAELFRA